jgi:hypothetical protein
MYALSVLSNTVQIDTGESPMKKLCPVCKTPQRFRKRRGLFKLHHRDNGQIVYVSAVLNKDVEPSLRSSRFADDVAIEAYVRPRYEWCDGIVAPKTASTV